MAGKETARSSNFRGVSWRSDKGKWQAQIRRTVDGKSKQDRLGYFPEDQAEAAAREYDKAAFAKSGRDAILNFPETYGLPPRATAAKAAPRGRAEAPPAAAAPDARAMVEALLNAPGSSSDASGTDSDDLDDDSDDISAPDMSLFEIDENGVLVYNCPVPPLDTVSAGYCNPFNEEQEQAYINDTIEKHAVRQLVLHELKEWVKPSQRMTKPLYTDPPDEEPWASVCDRNYKQEVEEEAARLDGASGLAMRTDLYDAVAHLCPHDNYDDMFKKIEALQQAVGQEDVEWELPTSKRSRFSGLDPEKQTADKATHLPKETESEDARLDKLVPGSGWQWIEGFGRVRRIDTSGIVIPKIPLEPLSVPHTTQVDVSFPPLSEEEQRTLQHEQELFMQTLDDEAWVQQLRAAGWGEQPDTTEEGTSQPAQGGADGQQIAVDAPSSLGATGRLGDANIEGDDVNCAARVTHRTAGVGNGFEQEKAQGAAAGEAMAEGNHAEMLLNSQDEVPATLPCNSKNGTDAEEAGAEESEEDRTAQLRKLQEDVAAMVACINAKVNNVEELMKEIDEVSALLAIERATNPSEYHSGFGRPGDKMLPVSPGHLTEEGIMDIARHNACSSDPSPIYEQDANYMTVTYSNGISAYLL